MGRIVRSFNKQSGITYIYEIISSEWDPISKNSVSKRKLVGKINPSTGEIVPTGPRGRPRKKTQKAYSDDSSLQENHPSVVLSEDNKNASVSDSQSQVDYKKLYEQTLGQLHSRDQRIRELEQQLNDILKEDEAFFEQFGNSFQEFKINRRLKQQKG